MDVKQKIKKLLALAESPNEHEAKAALLKARELMAEHKITERECVDAGKQAVKKTVTEYTFNKRRELWLKDLSAIIGMNYCCKAYNVKTKGKQTRIVGFVGLEDDVNICTSIYAYAVDCVRAACKRIRADEYYDSVYAKEKADSYAIGFCRGLQAAFQKQQEEHQQEWGLILVMPKEVADVTGGFAKDDIRTAAKSISASRFREGYKDGLDFDPSRRIKAGTAQSVAAIGGKAK